MKTQDGGESQDLQNSSLRKKAFDPKLPEADVNKDKRNTDLASVFEIFLVLIFIYYFVHQYGPDANKMSGTVGGIIISILLNTQFVPWLTLLLFFEIFVFILLRKTIVVGAVLIALEQLTKKHDSHGFIEDQAEASSIEMFAYHLQRSRKNVEDARRRPNALLFVGTVIAVSGLIFFVYTLPDFGSSIRVVRGSLDSLSKSIDGNGANYEETIEHKMSTSEIFAQVIPRLSMLIFIQILAGFFLRQYRSSMEEFRYYEAILRAREDQYLSFILRKESVDTPAIKEFATYLLNVRDFGYLDKDKSTQVLEAQKYEANEFLPVIQKLISLLPIKQEQDKNRPE